MTKMLFTVANNFDPKRLQFEHAEAVKLIIDEQRKACFFTIIQNSKLEELVPQFLQSEESSHKIQKYL